MRVIPTDTITTEELLRRAEELMTKPMNLLTDEEWAVMTAGLIIMDAREGNVDDCITLRNYCYAWGPSPRELLSLMKPYLPIVEEELRKLGFFRASKYGWRRFKANIPEDRIRELARRANLTEDEAYVVYVAWRLLKRTVPNKRDWKGLNIVHAWAFHDRLWKPQSEFSKEDVNWMLKRLVKYYKDQILELGLDYDRLLKMSFL